MLLSTSFTVFCIIKREQTHHRKMLHLFTVLQYFNKKNYGLPLFPDSPFKYTCLFFSARLLAETNENSIGDDIGLIMLSSKLLLFDNGFSELFSSSDICSSSTGYISFLAVSFC